MAAMTIVVTMTQPDEYQSLCKSVMLCGDVNYSSPRDELPFRTFRCSVTLTLVDNLSM